MALFRENYCFQGTNCKLTIITLSCDSLIFHEVNHFYSLNFTEHLGHIQCLFSKMSFLNASAHTNLFPSRACVCVFADFSNTFHIHTYIRG
jgi:hypothetical protein